MHRALSVLLTELWSQFASLYGARFVRMVEIARTGGIIADLSLKHGVVIACLFMDQEQFMHGQGPLLRNVRRDGISV